jgi:hypothetical protein
MSIVRGAWYAREAFGSEVGRLLSGVHSTAYFTDPRLQWLRDAWIADSFARAIGAHQVRLPEEPWPDFQIRYSDGAIVQYEATEAMQPGRKRGDEYRAWQSNGWKIRHVSQEELEARRDAIPLALRTAVKAKVRKQYPKDAALVVYLNISSHFWDDDTIPNLSEFTKEAFGPFDSVWVLWGSRAHRCWPQG